MTIPFPVAQAITLMVIGLFFLTVRTVALHLLRRCDEANDSSPGSVSTEIQVNVTQAGVNRSWSLPPGASRKQAEHVANEVMLEILT
jgi:hypothetical protein